MVLTWGNIASVSPGSGGYVDSRRAAVVLSIDSDWLPASSHVRVTDLPRSGQGQRSGPTHQPCAASGSLSTSQTAGLVAVARSRRASDMLEGCLTNRQSGPDRGESVCGDMSDGQTEDSVGTEWM